jgi:predicted metalloprotease with PDZ domain
LRASAADLALGVLFALAASCAAAPASPPSCPTEAASKPPSSSPIPGTLATSEPVLSLRLVPALQPTPSVRVEIGVTGALAKLPTWRIQRAETQNIAELLARDAKGPVPVVVRAASPGVELALGRATEGKLVLSYRVAAEPFSDDVLGVAVDPNHMRISGERLIALPEDAPDRPIVVSVAIDPSLGYLTAARAASSFGVGNERRFESTPAALRRGTYVAGVMGQAVLDGPEGHDEVAWLGYTSFDPRSIAAEVATFRTAAREYFGEKKVQSPFTLLILTDSRLEGEFDVARRTQSVLLHVAPGQIYNGPLRVTVSHQLLREWMGSVLYVGPLDPAKSGEAAWFTDGVTRYLARELDFRFGLLSSAEYLAEVEELERIVATSPFAKKSNAELAAEKSQAALALAVARGARHAADVDARIRKKSGGKRSLDGLLRKLYAEARKVGGPLGESVWLDALKAELDQAGAASYAHVAQGSRLDLPADALGKCFASEPRRYETFALGFEVEGGVTGTVKSVTPKGPAERAGVRVGDVVKRTFHRAGDASVPVKLTFERAGKETSVEYRPVGAVVNGTGFRRTGQLTDAECARR